MSLLDKLLGRRPRTAANIAAELSARGAELTAAKARMASAVMKRAAALDAQDAVALKAVDDEAAADGLTAELAAHAIAALEAAHAERIKVEEREQFRADVASAEREAVAMTASLQAEYPEAAQRLAAILDRMAKHRANEDSLRERGRKLGESVKISNATAFRDGPQRWRVTWPGESGGQIVGSPEDAPRGSIRWVGGKPVAARDGVTVEPRRVESADSLLDAIKYLPGLLYGDAPYYRASEPWVPPPRMPV
ncbi:hypothetical protein ASF28_11360 [Methylobacterium sp. Leaf99]|uniref:hypothetical protein n=1 Tax=Methylobacterium sp. Leaf99 TaxID=1736251 RepID=UPI0006F4B424|nr:hypothetical protein [Methylobacterium sp. Leaf99]KQP07717.1 hypothetical protein ASF28_11360 [Methylobacterium sp. Leaf99]